MREIKFRAWDIQKKEYHYPSLWDKSMPSNWQQFYILEQFTGLTDKKGVEIYEGDIVEFKANYTNKPRGYMNGLVVFGTYNLELHVNRGIYSCEDETDEFPYNCEVLGNIHSNPELL